MKAYFEAVQKRRENGEAGFSLVELIVVVVILGILAAVAIPIFNGIQTTAEKNASDAAAANMASEVAAKMANAPTTAPTLPASSATQPYTYTWSPTAGTAPTTIDKICVIATKGTAVSAPKGPGCA